MLAFGVAAAPGIGADGDVEGKGAEEAGGVEEAVAERSDDAETARERPVKPPVARDVFVPSEEISEDVEVPFPVDI